MGRWVLLLLLLTTAAVRAQTVDVTQWQSGRADLSEGWREHDGDNQAWAQAHFDDHAWDVVDLDDLGAAQPGWRWFRLHVKLADGHPHVHLLIAGGDGTYTLYVNGRGLEGPALRSPFGVKRPTERLISLENEDSDLEIALRTFTPPNYAAWHLPLFLTVALGTPGTIDSVRQAMESQRLYSALPSTAINLLVILAGIGAFALYRSQRTHYEYLWLGLYLGLLGLSNLLFALALTGVVPMSVNMLIADPLLYVVTMMQIEFTFSFAGQRVGRGWRIYEALLLVPWVLIWLTWTGHFRSDIYVLVEATAILPAALLLPVVLLLWYRRGNREAGWLILPSLLPAAMAALYDIGTASIYFGWKHADFLDNPILWGPIPLQPPDLGDLLFVLAIGVVMFFRFTRVSRDQTRAAAELEAAREVQQRLVPARLPKVEGYTIEAAYFPAEEVGGDFYQVLASGDGAQLVVLGDVSGKGLKAAMTGTMALGALRLLAAEGLSPAALLGRLNRQIAETHDEGFITCLCVRITAQGHVTVANAGHLAPYQNGEEVQLESGLPLGVTTEAEYGEQSFALAPEDRLTLLSDGVVEARSRSGELFGFERTQAISAQSADAIAQAARTFGQEDDITVLTLQRVMRGEVIPAHAAPVLAPA